MKNILLILLFTYLFVSCNRQPVLVDEKRIIFIDELTKSDTIIVNYNLQYNILNPDIYYAEKNWQINTSSLPKNGFRSIGIRDSDTIFLTTNIAYNYEKYVFKFSTDGDQLISQKFLLTPTSSSSKNYRKL
jgi:hypothetical protein